MLGVLIRKIILIVFVTLSSLGLIGCIYDAILSNTTVDDFPNFKCNYETPEKFCPRVVSSLR